MWPSDSNIGAVSVLHLELVTMRRDVQRWQRNIGGNVGWSGVSPNTLEPPRQNQLAAWRTNHYQLWQRGGNSISKRKYTPSTWFTYQTQQFSAQLFLFERLLRSRMERKKVQPHFVKQEHGGRKQPRWHVVETWMLEWKRRCRWLCEFLFVIWINQQMHAHTSRDSHVRMITQLYSRGSVERFQVYLIIYFIYRPSITFHL